MATTSFDKDFIVRDSKAIASFQKSLADTATPKTFIERKDIKQESAKGIELLKRSLSR